MLPTSTQQKQQRTWHANSPGMLTHLACYGHSAEHIPQNNADNDVVSQIENDTFAVIVSTVGRRDI